MKLLTTEQLRSVCKWFEKDDFSTDESLSESEKLAESLDSLITAECHNHGFAGIEDAYQRLIERGEQHGT